MSRWIDGDGLNVGDVGFLVGVLNTSNGGLTKFSLREGPVRGNRSGDPVLDGWAGETNNRSVYGHGMAKVARVARNGRVLVVPIAGEELRTALEELGYPELMPG